MKAFYNDIDAYAASWLRNLASAGHITPGHVEETPIEKLKASQLTGFQRLHFFAGLGGWDHALDLAGWPAEWPVWTGSCPCQPFSDAGLRKGEDDPRHLWPAFHAHIAEHRPPVIFGEQVASKDGRQWLLGVRSDLEALGYEVGVTDYCAAGQGAPNIRQRLWWVAYSNGGRLKAGDARQWRLSELDPSGPDGGVAYTQGERRRQAWRARRSSEQRLAGTGATGGRLGDADSERCEGSECEALQGPRRRHAGREAGEPGGASRGLADAEHDGRGSDEQGGGSQRREAYGRHHQGPLGMGDSSDSGLPGEPRGRTGQELEDGRADGGARDDFWSDYELLPCADGKARRVEPGTFPLAHGVPARVGKLCAYGNAINPWVAKIFIESVIEYILETAP